MNGLGIGIFIIFLIAPIFFAIFEMVFGSGSA